MEVAVHSRYSKDMELVKVIAELRAERAAIEQALAVLERLARARGKRRGRPPAWLAMARSASGASSQQKTPVLPADVRKRMAEGQKKRWAAYRKAKAAESK